MCKRPEVWNTGLGEVCVGRWDVRLEVSVGRGHISRSQQAMPRSWDLPWSR